MYCFNKNIIAGGTASQERQVWRSTDQRIDQLEQWLKDHKGVMPKNSALKTQEEKGLATWISQVRSEYIVIDERQRHRLLDLGVDLHKQTQSTDELIDEIVTWVNNHNNKFPVSSALDPIEKRLANYLNGHVRCGRSKLTPEQKQKLLDIGFDFGSQRMSPDKRIQQLAKWLKDNNGQFPDRNAVDAVERALAFWIKDVRLGKTPLTNLQKQKLVDLGVCFEKAIYITIDQRIDQLAQSLKEHHGSMPKQNTPDSVQNILAAWVSKVCCGKIAIDDLQRQRLIALGVSMNKKNNNNNARHLDSRKASGEQLFSITHKPRRINEYDTPLEIGTAILSGTFEKDTTNIFNPDGWNAGGRTVTHIYMRESGNFTDQSAVETTVYSDIRDLLGCLNSQIPVGSASNPRQSKTAPVIQGQAFKLFKIGDAEEMVLALSLKFDQLEAGKLLDAYEAAKATPENWDTARILVDILKNLKIKYNSDLFAAYLLLLSEQYDAIVAQIKLIPITPEISRLAAETVTKLTLIKHGLVADIASYKDLCIKYNIQPDKDLNKLVRLIRLNMQKLSPELKQLLFEISIAAEDLAVVGN